MMLNSTGASATPCPTSYSTFLDTSDISQGSIPLAIEGRPRHARQAVQKASPLAQIALVPHTLSLRTAAHRLWRATALSAAGPAATLLRRLTARQQPQVGPRHTSRRLTLLWFRLCPSRTASPNTQAERLGPCNTPRVHPTSPKGTRSHIGMNTTNGARLQNVTIQIDEALESTAF